MKDINEIFEDEFFLMDRFLYTENELKEKFNSMDYTEYLEYILEKHPEMWGGPWDIEEMFFNEDYFDLASDLDELTEEVNKEFKDLDVENEDINKIVHCILIEAEKRGFEVDATFSPKEKSKNLNINDVFDEDIFTGTSANYWESELKEIFESMRFSDWMDENIDKISKFDLEEEFFDSVYFDLASNRKALKKAVQNRLRHIETNDEQIDGVVDCIIERSR